MTVDLKALLTGGKVQSESSGDAVGLTASQLRALINVEDGADVTDATNVDAAGAVMASDYDANTILAATTDNTPAALTVAASRIVGRAASGGIAALTATQARTVLDVGQLIDEDDMASNSATRSPSQQSVKAYADALHLLPTVSAWSPAIDQAGNVARTVDHATYQQHPNGTVTAVGKVTITGSGSGGTAFTMSLPVNSSVTGLTVGTATVVANSTRYVCSIRVTAAGLVNFQVTSNTLSAGASPSFALANGNIIEFVIFGYPS